MKWIAILTLAGALAACGTAGSSNPNIQTAHSSAGAAFASYRTFGFRLSGQPSAPYDVTARSFDVERRMRPLIVAELVRRGYQETTGEGKPDFIVAFGSGYAQEPAGTVSPAELGGSAAATPPVEKGKLVVDAFDTSTDAQVWHGTAEAEVNPDKIDDKLLQGAIQRLLTTFPPRNGMTMEQAQ
jgi:Pyruvate/2-oxoacid:ferredoxin oxidoreductase gamma subunit